MICLDLGAGALGPLTGQAPPERLDGIVISHLHPDHCVDLLSLRVYMAYGPGRGHTVRVIGPPGLAELMFSFGGDDSWQGVTFEELPGDGESITIGDLRLTWAAVPHAGPTYAVRVDAGAAAMAYGADCAWNPALVELAAGANVLVAECSHGPGPVPAEPIHMSAPEAARIARDAGVERLLLTHCFPEHDRDATLAAATAELPGRVAWAVQGEEVPASAR